LPEKTIWISDLRISDQTAQKLSSKHGLEVAAVRDAIQCVKGLPFVWDDDPEPGSSSNRPGLHWS